MSKITKEHIDIIREYLLSFDDEVRNKIRNTINTPLLNYITIIENGFINDVSIDKISNELGVLESSEDLISLRNEYFVSLAQISIENGSNSDLEQLKISKNQSFQKLLDEMSDAEFFEKDMSLSLKLIQREEMKKRFQQLDDEDEFEFSEKEMKAAITMVERKSMKEQFTGIDKAEGRIRVLKLVTRYAIAATIVGIVFSGTYLLIFNSKPDTGISFAKKDSINKNNESLANVKLPDFIEKNIVKKGVVHGKVSSAFALMKDSVTIEVNGLYFQMDHLRKMWNELQIDNTKGNGPVGQQIIKQIDSLQALLNTYTFNSSTKKATFNLPMLIEIKNIISIDPENLSKFYINIGEQYYLIETNKKPVKLIPVTNKSIIESLQKVEFLNE